jgi:Flp pilus assembly protein CpaB
MTSVDSHHTTPPRRSLGRHGRPSRTGSRAGGGPELRRATPLPSGRAVVGALLMTVAALGVFVALRSAGDGPDQAIVVAATDVPIGHRLSAADVRVQRGQLPEGTSSATFDSAAATAGAITVAPLRAGDIVQRSAVIGPTPGGGDDQDRGRQFSFSVERDRALDGALQRGERVDVLATYGTGDGAFTNVVARDVTLVDIDTGPKSGAIGSTTKITFTVSPASADDILRLAHATEVAPITLVRTSGSPSSDSGDLDSVHSPTTSTTNTRSAATASSMSSTTTAGSSSNGSTTNGTQRGGG